MIVDLVNEFQLKIFRIAYYKFSVKKFTPLDPKLHGLNFFGLTQMIQHELESKFIIPVIDGLDEHGSKHFNNYSKSLSTIRCTHISKENISVQNAHNLSEPVFASSQYYTLIQLVDMISYLLQKLDNADNEKNTSDFKKNVQNIARNIDPKLLVNHLIEMKEIKNS